MNDLLNSSFHRFTEFKPMGLSHEPDNNSRDAVNKNRDAVNKNRDADNKIADANNRTFDFSDETPAQNKPSATRNKADTTSSLNLTSDDDIIKQLVKLLSSLHSMLSGDKPQSDDAASNQGSGNSPAPASNQANNNGSPTGINHKDKSLNSGVGAGNNASLNSAVDSSQENILAPLNTDGPVPSMSKAGILSSTQHQIANDPNGAKAMADPTMQKSLKAVSGARLEPPANATMISSEADFDKIKSGGTYVLKDINMSKGLDLSGKKDVTLYVDGKLDYSPASGPASNSDLSKSTITARGASNINIIGTERGSISNNGNASGIRMSQVDNVNVQGLKISNAHEGIAFQNASSNVTARGNVIDGTSARGMWTLDRVEGAHFENNIIANTGKNSPAGDSIDFDARTNGSIAKDNVFIAPGRWGLLHEEGSGAQKANLVSGNLQLNTGARKSDNDAEMFIMDNGTQIAGLPDTGPVEIQNNRLLSAHNHNYLIVGAGQHKDRSKLGDLMVSGNTINGNQMQAHQRYNA